MPDLLEIIGLYRFRCQPRMKQSTLSFRPLRSITTNRLPPPKREPDDSDAEASSPPQKKAKQNDNLSLVAIKPPGFNLQTHLCQLFEALHAAEPQHEIFGEPLQGLIRLPMNATRANGQSWINVSRRIARWVSDEMGGTLLSVDTCWMSRQTQLQITATLNNKVKVYRQITVVRLLAFLANPTPTAWQYLCEKGTRAIDTPFSHRCGRGLKRDATQSGVCINGIGHGRFATREENESHKLCTNGAKALCPGHGSPPVKCIFTYLDGSLKPCLNQEEMVPKCTCMRKCF